MNETAFPSRQELKSRAKSLIAQSFFPCCALGLLIVLAGFALNWFLQNSGGAIDLYYWDCASSDIQTSFRLGEDGLFAAMRLEEYGIGLSVAVTPAIFGAFLLARLAATAVFAPLRLGCLENLWAIRRGERRRLRDVFQWYTDWKKAGKAILLQVLLWAERAALTLIFSLPALAVLCLLPVTSARVSAAMWLFLLALAAVWCIMTQFEPVRFQLARAPETGIGGALIYGRSVLTRRHGAYLKFRLSFLIWELLNSLSQDLFQLYLFPYLNLSAMEFVLEAERQIKETYKF